MRDISLINVNYGEYIIKPVTDVQNLLSVIPDIPTESIYCGHTFRGLAGRFKAMLTSNATCAVCQMQATYAGVKIVKRNHPDFLGGIMSSSIIVFRLSDGHTLIDYRYDNKNGVRRILCSECAAHADNRKGMIRQYWAKFLQRRLVEYVSIEDVVQRVSRGDTVMQVNETLVKLNSRGFHYFMRFGESLWFCKNCGIHIEKFGIAKKLGVLGKKYQYVIMPLAKPYCNEEIYVALEIDHIIPVSRKGSKCRRENHQILCTTCNKIKGANNDIQHTYVDIVWKE
jgi:hypothetical protein